MGAGQTLALFAVLLPGLIAGVGLGLDGANLALSYRDAQSAADLAALAGSRMLSADNPSSTDFDIAEARAVAVAASNGYTGAGVTATATAPYDVNGDGDIDDGTSAPDERHHVEVEIVSSVQMFFLPILSVNTMDIGVRAVAASEWTATGGTFPAVFAGCGYTSAPCSAPKDKAIDWSGSNGEIIGGMHSNCGILVGGSGNEVEGGSAYSNAPGCGFSGGGNSYDPAAGPTAPIPFPVDYTAASFACDFIVNGKMELKNYYKPPPAGPKVLKDGVYCARGPNAEMILDEQYVTGKVTLVVDRAWPNPDTGVCGSGGKEIKISGSDFNLTAYHSTKVLIYSNVSTLAVAISGSVGSWNGLIVAPCGQVEISGQSVGTSGGGSVLANTVKIAGSDVVIDSNGLSTLGPSTLESLRLYE